MEIKDHEQAAKQTYHERTGDRRLYEEEIKMRHQHERRWIGMWATSLAKQKKTAQKNWAPGERHEDSHDKIYRGDDVDRKTVSDIARGGVTWNVGRANGRSAGLRRRIFIADKKIDIEKHLKTGGGSERKLKTENNVKILKEKEMKASIGHLWAGV